MKILIVLSILFTVALYSCSDGDQTKKNDGTASSYDKNIAKGKVEEKIACIDNPAETYALYIPKCYNTDTILPCIFVFDPHAKGSFPLNKYKDLAEKYGYILVGCNTSKNGMSWDEANKHIKTLFADIFRRYSVDKRKIYTMGFSGGARVASSIAIFNGGITGIVACSGGFPSIDKPIKKPFNFIGFAGNEEVSYLEMNELDKSLDRSPFKHWVDTYDGGHEWPSAEQMEDAFYWMAFNAMRDMNASVNDSLINTYIRANEAKISTYNESGDIYNEYITYKKLFTFLDGIKTVSDYNTKIAALESSDKLKKALTEQTRQLEKEKKLQKFFISESNGKNLNWWNTEVGKLHAGSKNTKNPEARLCKRVLSFLSLIIYSNANVIVNQNKFPQAEFILKVYELVDPQNPDVHYFYSRLYTRQGKTDQAIASLETAVKYGFSDLGRLEVDSVMAKLNTLDKYKEIVSKIKGVAN